jgi:uncharacterized membrane protein
MSAHTASRADASTNQHIGSRANKALKASATFWLTVVILGQAAFAIFVAGFYGVSSLQGNFAAWAKNTTLLKGYVVGDTTGNMFFAAHMLIAIVIACSGVLQLIPQIRARAATFHRWNGRIFLLAILAGSMSGLYLTLIRKTSANPIGAIAISLDAILIILFAILAWRAARARDFTAHRQWALRTFIVANGVWFQRLGYLAWMVINQGPVGITKQMDGAFDLFWAFGSYLLPLAVLELYLRAKESGNALLKVATALTISVSTLLMMVGIAGLTLFMWLPLLKRMWL